MMLERSFPPSRTLEALLLASKQLRLPVNIDRRLNDLLRDDLGAAEILSRLAHFVRRLDQ